MSCRLDLHGGVLIQSPPCGFRANPKAFSFMTRHPEITFLEGLSEAADEVASGDWLRALAAAGVEASMAHARFLAELPEGVVRTSRKDANATVLHIERIRLPAAPIVRRVGARPLTFAPKRRVIKGLSSDRNHF
jgi:hypothetical protein